VIAPYLALSFDLIRNHQFPIGKQNQAKVAGAHPAQPLAHEDLMLMRVYLPQKEAARRKNT
jgi:hypothetical protein